jgi:hypothetical protein
MIVMGDAMVHMQIVRQKARGKFGPRDKPIKARTYLDGTQLGAQSRPCWKC